MDRLDRKTPLLLAMCCLAFAQDDWQTAAGGPRAFDVAPSKLDPGPFRPPNFPLDPGEPYPPAGRRFVADLPLATSITFASQRPLSATQLQAMVPHLPERV